MVSLLGFLRLLTDPEPKHSYLAVSIFFSLFFYMGLYSYSASLGGDSPALRPWLAMMPMLAILFAKSFDFLHTRWLLFIFFLPTLYMTFGSSAYQLGITTVYTNWVNPFFSASGGGPFNNLGLYLPQLSDRSAFDLQDAFAVIWISLLLLAIFTAVVNFEKVATQLQLLKLKTASWLKPARKYSK